MDNVILNKMAIIERCIKRINEEYIGREGDFDVNYTVQDSIILNLQRACEAAIDLGMRIVRIKKLGIPQESKDVFEILKSNHIIDGSLANHLQKMVGFRNVAVHDYQKLNLAVVHSIIKNHLSDFPAFIDKVKMFI